MVSQRVRDIDESDSFNSLRSATVWTVINKTASVITNQRRLGLVEKPLAWVSTLIECTLRTMYPFPLHTFLDSTMLLVFTKFS